MSFKRKYRQTTKLAWLLSKSASPRAELAASHDVGGEYAVLMMVDGGRTPIKPAFHPQNLDAPPLSPYTSAAPFDGRDFEPPSRAQALSEVPGMEEDF
jgi:hypothetical protein